MLGRHHAHCLRSHTWCKDRQHQHPGSSTAHETRAGSKCVLSTQELCGDAKYFCLTLACGNKGQAAYTYKYTLHQRSAEWYVIESSRLT